MEGESFGQRVRRLRLVRGITQEQLANRSVPPTTRQSVWNVENGLTGQPHRETVMAWAETLGVSEVYLLTGQEKPPVEYGDTWPLEAALRASSKLSEDDIQSVAKIVRALEVGHADDDDEDGDDEPNGGGLHATGE